MPVKLGFKNFYLYSAVEPRTGENFTLEISHVNTKCLSVFLKELAKTCPDDEIILVMDGAGWHRSKDLLIPPSIDIVYLPPYSPELNPVERFWEHIKRYTLRNQVYLTLNALKERVANFLNALDKTAVQSICAAKYAFD